MSKGKKRRPGVCVYCGEDALLTDDHIPPKTLYPPELRSKLLLVSSCARCNNGASKDDEYLRTMIALSAKGQGDENLKTVSDATVRALIRPQAAGFQKSIVSGIQETFVPGPAGTFKPALVGNVDLERFDRVVARIIRGIFSFERGVRLASEYAVVNYSLEGLRRVPIEVGRQLQVMIEPIIAREPKHIGGPQFIYWSDYNPEDPNVSMWIMVIHRHHFFIGWTVKAADAMVRHDQSTGNDANEAGDRESR